MIYTDQKSLVHLEQQRLTTPWQQKAFTKLLGLQYKIKYKKGSENTASDALSHANPSAMLSALTVCQPAWLEDIKSSYNNNLQAQRLLEQLAVRRDPKGQFTLQQGIIRFWAVKTWELSTRGGWIGDFYESLQNMGVSKINIINNTIRMQRKVDYTRQAIVKYSMKWKHED